MGSKQDDSGIFGSPPEPIFNLKPAGAPHDLLEEWLYTMAEDNVKALQQATFKQGFFKNGEYAETVFQTCEKLGLKPEAKYLSVEIFDRFMIQHMRDLHEHVLTSDSVNKMEDWLAIQERVKNQVLLRLVTCCQLASKLTSHYKIVSPRKAKVLLGSLGHKYSLESMVQSELRVLKTLNFQICFTTPLTFIETLLEIIGKNEKTAEVKIYYGVCIKVLDLFYMNRDYVYQCLFHMVQENVGISRRSEFDAVENDLMLMSVGIIAAASYVVDQQNTDKVIEHLGDITGIKSTDILDVASVLIKIIIRGPES